ncbi:HNH endonuclease [Flavobacterium selenitireducens]|uniref:HNH endonuclease n=1 Tax=Flavobacterium selenitireducens TaxID=2722704 RepID=UPI00168BF51C|nr:HNH endonuclease [Flavobacterium selenitireducens]MBD3581714.1 HNH endonuclease [Flavobacterium selenitireducens]
MSAKKILLDHFLENVGVTIGREELTNLTQVLEWQRVIRNLRQEGWDIQSLREGYVLHSDVKRETVIRRVAISNKLRYSVLQRDNSKCRRCGKTVEDGVKLEVDHKLPVDWGGSNDIDNLWTLCHECNGGKKHFFSDLDQDVMKEVMKESSGYKKIKKYFQLLPNTMVEPIHLDIVSGIRDWERTLRLIRGKEKMNIVWFYSTKEFPSGGYKYITEDL